jgi:transcriptional regulator with XRE-family HTH domain
MSGNHVPSLSSRRLGRRLRVLREARGITCDRAAAALGNEPVWLVQVEIGQDQITTGELRRLLDLYEVTDEAARAELVELAGRCGGPGWLQPHVRWLSELERDLIILESEAGAIRAYGILLIPELLRTEAYARVILTGVRLPTATTTVEEELDLLRGRQRHHREQRPRRRQHVILDESAITRHVNDVKTMAGQLQYLIEQAKLEHTTIQLIPREVGAHVGLDGSFHILDFTDPSEPSVSISHSALGPLLAYIDLDDRFDKLTKVALGPADSLFMIEQALGDL